MQCCVTKSNNFERDFFKEYQSRYFNWPFLIPQDLSQDNVHVVVKDQKVFYCPDVVNLSNPPKSIHHRTNSGMQESGAGGATGRPLFDISVDPIQTRGADCAHPLLLAPPNFFTFRHH